MSKVVVLGAGGWGTALSIIASENNDVTLWSMFKSETDAILADGENKKLLPGVPFPKKIALSNDLACVKNADLIIFAVPSFAVAQTASKIGDYVGDGCLIANAGKGLDADDYSRLCEVISRELPTARTVALSGPSHAEEAGCGVPTTVVSACENIADAEQVQQIMMTRYFRIYTNTDKTGVELGGALKNVIALASGMCDGLEIGDNTRAALITRGLTEMARLGVKLGGRAETFAGLSGLGDLIVTCGSMHSRNRRAGILIGQGVSADEAVKKVGTVEGFFAVKAAYSLSRKVGTDMPITDACYKICYEGMPVREAVENLMTRPMRSESEPEVWF